MPQQAQRRNKRANNLDTRTRETPHHTVHTHAISTAAITTSTSTCIAVDVYHHHTLFLLGLATLGSWVGQALCRLHPALTWGSMYLRRSRASGYLAMHSLDRCMIACPFQGAEHDTNSGNAVCIMPTANKLCAGVVRTAKTLW